jgi:hypothetical protein
MRKLSARLALVFGFLSFSLVPVFVSASLASAYDYTSCSLITNIGVTGSYTASTSFNVSVGCSDTSGFQFLNGGGSTGTITSIVFVVFDSSGDYADFIVSPLSGDMPVNFVGGTSNSAAPCTPSGGAANSGFTLPGNLCFGGYTGGSGTGSSYVTAMSGIWQSDDQQFSYNGGSVTYTPPVVNACSSPSVAAFNWSIKGDQSLTVGFPTNNQLAIAVAVNNLGGMVTGDPPNFYSSLSSDGENFTDVFLANFGTGTSTFTMDINLTSNTGSFPPTDFELWCQPYVRSGSGYAPGPWVDLGNLLFISAAQSTLNTNNGNTNSLGCYNSSGLGLDPVSWVPGLVNMAACVGQGLVQALFVPSSSSVSSFTGLWSAGGGGGASASQWLGSMATLAAATPASEISAIQKVADSGSCFQGAPSIPSMSVGGHSLGLCAILSAPSSVVQAAGWLVFLKTFLSVVIYGAAALLLFQFLRSVLK